MNPQRTRKKRRIMRALKLEEISSVDIPAQRGATMTILKRYRGDENEMPGGSAMSEPNTFDEAIERLQKRDPSIGRATAMSRARKVWPNLLVKCREETAAIEAMNDELARADLQKRHAPEVERFEKRCDELQAQFRLSRVEAYRRAAREMPADEFQEYRRAMID